MILSNICEFKPGSSCKEVIARDGCKKDNTKVLNTIHTSSSNGFRYIFMGGWGVGGGGINGMGQCFALFRYISTLTLDRSTVCSFCRLIPSLAQF